MDRFSATAPVATRARIRTIAACAEPLARSTDLSEWCLYVHGLAQPVHRLERGNDVGRRRPGFDQRRRGIVVLITDSSGKPYGVAPLETVSSPSGGTTLTGMPPGNYGVTAQLVDANVSPVSRMTPSQTVTVPSGGSAAVGLDFPASAFVDVTGTLNVTWTIESSTDPARCTAHAAAEVWIQLSGAAPPNWPSASGTYSYGTNAACSTFSASIPNVVAGTYRLTAQLLDEYGGVASSTLPAQSVTVVGGGVGGLGFDFPTSTFGP